MQENKPVFNATALGDVPTPLPSSEPKQEQIAPEPQAQQQPNDVKNTAVFGFLLFAIALGIKVASLLLLKDDHVHIFPALLGDYAKHFAQFTYDYGLQRPLGLGFFYLFYTLYLFSPVVSHIAIFALQVTSGYLLYKLFAKHLPEGISAILALIFVTLPFFSEQYGWIAAGNATFATLTLIAQLYVISRTDYSFNKKLLLAMVLQLLGVFSYENVFFTFIPVAFALGYSHKKILTKRMIISLITLSIPSILYYVLKTFVFPAHYAGFAREASVGLDLIPIMIDNIQRLFAGLAFLFFEHGPIEVYWKYNLLQGIQIVLRNPLILLALAGGVGLLGKTIYEEHNSGANTSDSPQIIHNPLLWIAVAFFTIAPSLLLAQGSFPFRVIALPFAAMIIALTLVLYRYFRTVAYVLGGIVVIYMTLSTLTILQLMNGQAVDDERMFIQTVEGVEKKLPAEVTTSTVVLNNIPSSTQTILTYGEYLSTCASSDWCMQAAVNRRTGKIQKVIINSAELTKTDPSKNIFVFTYTPETKDLLLVE